MECSQGRNKPRKILIGAFGFGPPAFRLACRDLWIGWSPLAQETHRGRVIGLSRFLIRPGLRCQNLASRSYGLVLQRVAADWQERFGIKPVLVETYVDRQNHSGRSLAASNWQRLDQSTGRGRDQHPGQERKSIKDVWVFGEPSNGDRFSSQITSTESSAAAKFRHREWGYPLFFPSYAICQIFPETQGVASKVMGDHFINAINGEKHHIHERKKPQKMIQSLQVWCKASNCPRTLPPICGFRCKHALVACSIQRFQR